MRSRATVSRAASSRLNGRSRRRDGDTEAGGSGPPRSSSFGTASSKPGIAADLWYPASRIRSHGRCYRWLEGTLKQVHQPRKPILSLNCCSIALLVVWSRVCENASRNTVESVRSRGTTETKAIFTARGSGQSMCVTILSPRADARAEEGTCIRRTRKHRLRHSPTVPKPAQ